MTLIAQYLKKIIKESPYKIVISKPCSDEVRYKKISIEQKGHFFHISMFTDKQAFHENISTDQLFDTCIRLLSDHFLQLNAWNKEREFALSITKKGKVLYNSSSATKTAPMTDVAHNRRKKYILSEGIPIAPLVEMGVFTQDGNVVQKMYDKFKQINRFLELIDDTIRQNHFTHLNIIDFGCGKSYLTFIVYYYLTEIKNISVNMIGLDLKEDVIRKCNETAAKFHYDHLHFEMGDIQFFQCPFDVDMVITLHACDTATDFALYNAIMWNAKMIFSVPCCQHELNTQIHTDSLNVLTRYGIVRERFSALLTDSIRGHLLEYAGYKTQLVEFIDFEHTPKNILIRAIHTPILPTKVRQQARIQVEQAMAEFRVNPTLYQLLIND